MDPQLEQRILACPTLPSLPAVAVEVVRVCQREEPDLEQVVMLLERDPALAAKVLRIANSVSVAARSTVTTLTRALTLLGTNSVLTLALSFSLVSARRRSSRPGFDHDRYWRRALLSALGSRLLAEGARLDGEELFLSGLLQDLGMLVLDEVMPGEYGKLVAASAGDHARLVEREWSQLGADHAEVGSFLLARWNLPDLVVETSRGSHDPAVARADHPELGSAVACVHVSALLADFWSGGRVEPARDAAARHLGMPEDAFHDVLKRMGREIPAVANDFDLTLTGPGEIQAVLDRAKEALVLVSARADQSARQAAHAAESIAAENRGLLERSKRDALTSVLSRAQLDRALDGALAGAVERGQPLTLAFCDVDRFKQVNDAHGHATGDRVLAGVAAAIARAVRPGDSVGRFGGEEFVVVLPDTDGPRGLQIAERIRQEVEAATYEVAGGSSLRVTVSIGHATHRPRGELAKPGALLAAADACLYEAKRGGRNRVVGRR
jgi:diguanylate cyclase (GGDEF)-like protein